MIITIKKEDLLDPMDSAITIVSEEDAAHCDGSACGTAFSLDGEMIEPGPHHQTVQRGMEPKTSPRYFAIFSEGNS